MFLWDVWCRFDNLSMTVVVSIKFILKEVISNVKIFSRGGFKEKGAFLGHWLWSNNFFFIHSRFDITYHVRSVAPLIQCLNNYKWLNQFMHIHIVCAENEISLLKCYSRVTCSKNNQFIVVMNNVIYLSWLYNCNWSI